MKTGWIFLSSIVISSNTKELEWVKIHACLWHIHHVTEVVKSTCCSKSYGGSWCAVHCFTLWVNWKLHRWTCNPVWFDNLGPTSSRRAIRLQKQPKSFVVRLQMMIRWLKKFRSGYKKVDDQARPGRSKTVDSEAVLQVIKIYNS